MAVVGDSTAKRELQLALMTFELVGAMYILMIMKQAWGKVNPFACIAPELNVPMVYAMVTVPVSGI